MNDQITGKREIAINGAEANLYALVFIIPIILLFGLPFYFLHLRDLTAETLLEWLNNNRHLFFFKSIWILIILIAGIILHELIHGLVFMIFNRKGIKSVSFGIMWKYLSPYCHCSEPLKMSHYIIGALMPGVILGFIPATLSIITGKIALLLFGFIFSVAAGGDFLIIWLLRNESRDSLVLDHESKVGCYIIEE
jgi:hypothetical protein